MVSSLLFQKLSGEGLNEPPPQTPPPFFLGLRPRFSGFALNSRALRALDSGFALDTRALCALDSGFVHNFWLGTLVWAPKINSWIRPCRWRNSPRSTHFWRGWRGEERWICIQSRFLGYAIVANYNCTKSFRFDLKCTKIASGWGSAPDPAGGAYSAPPDPLAVN